MLLIIANARHAPHVEAAHLMLLLLLLPGACRWQQ
jgi:hypothetical protein